MMPLFEISGFDKSELIGSPHNYCSTSRTFLKDAFPNYVGDVKGKVKAGWDG